MLKLSLRFIFLLIISFFKLIKADVCIYSNNEMYVELDADLKETKQKYLIENKFDPYNTFFAECNYSELKQPSQNITLSNILNMEITVEYTSKSNIGIEKKTGYETDFPTDIFEIYEDEEESNENFNNNLYGNCKLLASTSGLANPYSEELTGIKNANIHKGYMVDIKPGVIATQSCDNESSTKCSMTVSFEFNYSVSVSTSYTTGNSHSEGVTLGTSRQDVETTSLQDSVAETIEESLCKTDTQEDSMSRAIELSNTITNTEESSLQKAYTKESNTSDTNISTEDFQTSHTENKSVTEGEEHQKSTTEENGVGLTAGANVSFGIDELFKIGGEISGNVNYSYSWGEINSTSRSEQNGSEDGSVLSKGSSTQITRGNSNSESTTDSKTDSISEARTTGNTSTNSSSKSNSIARTNNESTTNTFTKTKDIGVTISNDKTKTITDDVNWSQTFEETKSSSESITINKVFDANPGESCEYYISYSSYIINNIYECTEILDEDVDYDYFENIEPEVKYVLVHVGVPDIKKSEATEETKIKIQNIMSSRPQCVPPSSKNIDYFYFKENRYDNMNFHGNPMNAMKGVSNLCENKKICDINKLQTSYGGPNNGIIFKQESSNSSNFVLLEGSTNIWETYTYGFDASTTYFTINKLGHGEIIASDFLGYDKSTYAAEFKNVDYGSNPDFDVENDMTRQIINVQEEMYSEFFGQMNKTPVVLKQPLTGTSSSTETTGATRTITSIKTSTILNSITTTSLITPTSVTSTTNTVNSGTKSLDNPLKPTLDTDFVSNDSNLFNAHCYSEFLKNIFPENENIKIINYDKDKKTCFSNWPCSDVDDGIDGNIGCNLVCINEKFIKPDLGEDYMEIMGFDDLNDEYNRLVEECDCSDIESKCVGSYYTQGIKEWKQDENNFEDKKVNPVETENISKSENFSDDVCDHFFKCENDNWNDESCYDYQGYFSECNMKKGIKKRSLLKKRDSDIEIIKGNHVIWSTVGPGFQHSKVGFGNTLQDYKLLVSEEDPDFLQYTFNGLSLYDADKIMIWSSNPQAGDITVDKKITNGFYLPEFYGYPFLDGTITNNINYCYLYDKHVNLKKYNYIEENYMQFNGCNHFLKEGEGIRSENGRFALILQETGNLIFKDNKVTIWESQTANVWFGQSPYTLHLHEDGTLQVLDKNSYIIFQTINYENNNDEETDKGNKKNRIGEINKTNYRLEVLNSGTFRIMNSNGDEIWNMWDNKKMNKFIKYKEIRKSPLCNETFRPNALQYLSSSSENINHILVGERLYNELIIKGYDNVKNEDVTFRNSTANLYLSGAYIYFEDFNTKDYRIMNPITERNPRIVEGRLSDEGVFSVFDAYNNTLFTTGIKGNKTKKDETYLMFLTMTYHPEKNFYEPSHINIIHSPSNDLLWIFPPRNFTDLNSEEPEAYIRTLDGIIYNRDTKVVVDPEIGSVNTNYTNVGMCLLLRPDGAYAYGESTPFFPKENSKQLYLNENDGGIYIDGEKFKDIPEITNLPSRLHCDIVDETYELVLEDSKNNVVWQYPPTKKYSLTNNQRNNTLYIGNNLWLTPDEYCLTFNETGLYIQTVISDTEANVESKDESPVYSTVAILPSKDSAIFTIDPNESARIGIIDKNGIMNDYIAIDNPENHSVEMKCLSETSVVIIDKTNNQTLWSYPITQYEVLHLNDKLYMDQQLVENDNGRKACIKLKNDGIYMHGQTEPTFKFKENVSSIVLKKDGIYGNSNSTVRIIDFELDHQDLKEEEINNDDNFNLKCETYNGQFGMTLSVNEKTLWRYPKYNVKTILKSNDILYANEILYDKNGDKQCIQLKNGILYFYDEEEPMTLSYLSTSQIMKFDNEIAKDIHYIQVNNMTIDAFNIAKVKLDSIPINNNNKTDSVELFCSEIKGAYRFEIRNSQDIISLYPNLENKYILNEYDKLYEGESLKYINDSGVEGNCLTVHGNKVTIFDSNEPFYEGNGNIEYIMLTPTSIDVVVNDISKSIKAISKIKDKKVIIHCANYFNKDRLLIETEDSSSIFYTYPEYTKKSALTTSKGLSPEEGNYLLVGENLIYTKNENISCLSVRTNQVIYPDTSKNIFGVNYTKGFQLFITNENKLVINSQNGIQSLTEIYKFPTQKTVSLRCEQIDNKNALVAESDEKLIFIYPELTYEYLRSDTETHLSLYDKLVDTKGNICIMIQPDGIYKSNDITEFQKFNNLKYIYMDSKTGSVKYNDGTSWIDFSGRNVTLPTTMECINNDGSLVLQVKDNDGKSLYYQKINSNDGVCNTNNFIESYIYNNAICPGNKVYYEGTELVCLHYDKSKKGIYDGEGFKIFDAPTSENLELDPETGNLKLGSTTLLSFENPKLPLTLTCELVNNAFATVIKDSNGDYLWMHRQGRKCNQLISNDKNCNQLYIYEGIYDSKNQLIMSLTDKGISGIQEDIFTDGVLYMQVEDDGSIKTNKGVIFKTDHNTFPPYSIVRKEATITNDKGYVYQLVNVYEEVEYAMPEEQRRKRPVWNISEINTDESKRGRMYLGDTLDCGTYGLSIRSDKIVIREYNSENVKVLWKNLDGEVDYAQLDPSDGTFVVTDITNRQTIGSIGQPDSKTTAPYTMKCVGNGKVSIINGEGIILSTFPQAKAISSLTKSNSLTNNMELCDRSYCCLSIIDNIAYYTNSQGEKEILNKSETEITVNQYGQLVFSSNSKTIGSKKESGNYKVLCDSKNSIINIYNENNDIVNQYPVQGSYVTFRAHNGNAYYIGVNAIDKEINPVRITDSDSWQYYHTWYWRTDGLLAITDNNKKVTNYCLSLNSNSVSSNFSLKKCSETTTRFKTLVNFKVSETINGRKAQLIEIFDNSGKAITSNNQKLCVNNNEKLRSYYCNSNLKSNTGICWTITYV